ncbi:hypothetical protein TNCV_5034261 [Trichonephila clavipes]|nr:hypothetical protein TNCV_5034261 [Trichonephila clavipes]
MLSTGENTSRRLLLDWCSTQPSNLVLSHPHCENRILSMASSFSGTARSRKKPGFTPFQQQLHFERGVASQNPGHYRRTATFELIKLLLNWCDPIASSIIPC